MREIEGMNNEKIIAGLMSIVPHAVIAHHIPGRIRLKISLEGVKTLNGKMDAHDPLRVPGILSTRINRFARSIVIDYEEKRIPYDLWERLGQIKERPEAGADVGEAVQGGAGQ
ncbi:hypothetical protein [Desulfoglaeba alkanexedens]|uniref:Cation transporter n=1 Tax=Desulfoglaeba alkanexedens ALDC TaxID=980445 RepID=A0A4P8L4D7_9BACT|nr:hypothetical protein [Desulfoglaeba alkanexedens]QCQ22593.1 hypothetical protein FDQ92_10705 [Desulfoglaeba alkanexedens ALDC]